MTDPTDTIAVQIANVLMPQINAALQPIQSSLTSLSQSNSAILAAIKALGPVGSPTPTTLDSTTIPALIAAARPDASGLTNIVLPAGIFAPFDTSPAQGTTIRFIGATALSTIIDGQGGAAAGHRLIFGRAGINVARPHIILSGLKVINCGSASQSSDGESAIRSDAAWGVSLLEVQNCWLENNEDGILTSPDNSGSPVNLKVSGGTFRNNGVVPDSRSHSIYAEGQECHIDGTLFDGGAKYGWCVKSRCGITTISGATLKAGLPSGGCLDVPNGGQVTITGGLLSISIHGNIIGFNEEGNAHPGDMIFDGTTIDCNNQNPYILTGGGGNVIFHKNCPFPNGRPVQSPASTGGQVLFDQ